MIAYALQVAIDLDHRKDEAKVDRHRLLFGQQVVRHLIDVALGGVDGRFDLLHVVAEAHISRQVGFERERKSLLRESSHGEQLILQGDELLLKIDPGHEESLSECRSLYSDAEKGTGE